MKGILGLVVAAGFLIRLLVLLDVTANPRFVWHDPDSYAAKGLALAGDASGTGWEWSFDAVRHGVDGHDYALPPLYPAFLSLFALGRGFPFTAQLGQLLLATLTIVLIFWLGRALHSTRAGIIAAGAYAVWFPNVIAVWSTMQEALYVPLVVLAFVLFLRARDKPSWLRFALAGTAFGVAALTRSMPLYFLLPAMLLHVVLSRERRRSAAEAGVLLVGFLLLTVPYSVALSSHLGTPTFVENHGSIRILEKYSIETGGRPAGVATIVPVLARSLVESPGVFVSDLLTTARTLARVNGGRLLQIYIAADSPTGALVWKSYAHLGGDLILILTLILAPFGFAWSRRRDQASFLLLWILVNVALVAISGFGGARLRAPFEPHLMVLAGVVLSGVGFNRVKVLSGAAACVSVLLGWVTLAQLPGSLAARADYGVDWPRVSGHKRAVMTEVSGFNLLAAHGAVHFEVRRPKAEMASSSAELEVRLNGELVESGRLIGGGERLQYDWPIIELVYVELRATRADRRDLPARLAVIPRR